MASVFALWRVLAMSRRRRRFRDTAVTAPIEALDGQGWGLCEVDGQSRSRTFCTGMYLCRDGMDAKERPCAPRHKAIPGQTYRVQGALVGELARFRPQRRRKGLLEAKVEAVLEPSSLRVEPACPHFSECGACSLQHLEYGAQLALKQSWLLDAFAAEGELELPELTPPLAGHPWGYRRKARMGAKYVPAKGGVLVGFRERFGGRLAVLDHCATLDPAIGLRIVALRELLASLDARATIPQIEIAVGDTGCALILRHLEPLSEADRRQLRRYAQQEGLHLYLQSGGPETVVPLWPETPTLAYRLPTEGLEYRFQPLDFVQVNGPINRALVERALSWLAPESGEDFLDLYCGLGNFTLAIAARGGRVTGLEGDAELIQRARDNALANALQAEFHTVDLRIPEAFAPYLAQRWDGILLDPPRTGAAEVIDRLAVPYPRRILYISCNPTTLARDAAALLTHHGYRVSRLGAVDMFPQTAHLEAIALFERL